ncbi:hypothetical protein KFZ76_21005 [Methylovulum psychrotolerans]|uniref:hypothetical protein n=1 Tax=Methylovulum psychrotolerans TaxID=1704499 RepID=UPI001BFF5284|nr:hypothetical protein [Methylovulum psychrotolerans]MBT9100187.1 hypothetical protein [Methylovulum psychrotolerans]
MLPSIPNKFRLRIAYRRIRLTEWRKNGEDYPAWTSITAVYGDDGAVIYYVGMQSDMSHQKTAAAPIEQGLS